MCQIVWITKMPVNSFKNYHLSWCPEVDKLSRPCYLAIANLLEQDIRRGKLAPGTKLPPQRELADFLDRKVSGFGELIRVLNPLSVGEQARSAQSY